MKCAKIGGDRHMIMKILCSLCTQIDIPTLKYLARYTGLNIIFDWNNATAVQLFNDWFGFGYELQTLLFI